MLLQPTERVVIDETRHPSARLPGRGNRRLSIAWPWRKTGLLLDGGRAWLTLKWLEDSSDRIFDRLH